MSTLPIPVIGWLWQIAIVTLMPLIIDWIQKQRRAW